MTFRGEYWGLTVKPLTPEQVTAVLRLVQELRRFTEYRPCRMNPKCSG